MSIWDFLARRYNTLWVQRFALRPTRAALLARLPADPGQRLLDVGCGTGQLYGDLVARGAPFPAYTGFDASAAMIAVARTHHPEAAFAVCPVNTLPTPNTPYDLVVCAHAFPYFPDQPWALVTFHRFLRPGGRLLLAQACTDTPHDALTLAPVKLTTSPARFLGRRDLTDLAAPLFGQPVAVTRLSRRPTPTLALFEWIKPAPGSC